MKDVPRLLYGSKEWFILEVRKSDFERIILSDKFQMPRPRRW